MTKAELRDRTKKFHINVIRLCELLPKSIAAYETAKQLIRSGGSVGSNYRAACCAKSNADFLYKIQIVLEEADESQYWLEIIDEVGWLNKNASLPSLIREAGELSRIFTSTTKTLKSNMKPTPQKPTVNSSVKAKSQMSNVK